MQMMNKDKFLLVLGRQRGSGLSVRDFCGNEGYSVSSFYFWKRKFAPESASEAAPQSAAEHSAQRSASEAEHAQSAPPSGLTPVRFCSPPSVPLSAEASNDVRSQIRVDLPGGVTVSFRGTDHTRSALDFIRQIYRSDVLPH